MMSEVLHGGGVERAARAWRCGAREVLDLSTGVHPERDPDGLRVWLAEHADLVQRYPDPEGEPARSALAEALDLSSDRVLIVAGAQSVVDRLFDHWPVESIAIGDPEYEEVERCASRVGVDVRSTPIGTPFAPADATWVTSPNSHTGESPTAPTGIHDVLDESYASLERRRRNNDLNCLRIGSLTKTFSMPGLRLGYVVGSPDQLAPIRERQPPWPAPTVALHLLPERLPRWKELDALAREDVDRLEALLCAAGWEVSSRGPSFILVEGGDPSKFDHERILVRRYPRKSCLSAKVRIGLPGTGEEWARLERALR